MIGRSSRPWRASDRVPVSSETTMQRQRSKRSVIPRAARWRVPKRLRPWREIGRITPAERMRLPFTSRAPSCRGVLAVNRFKIRSTDSWASRAMPGLRKSSGRRSLPRSSTIRPPRRNWDSFPAASDSTATAPEANLSAPWLPNSTSRRPVPSNSISRRRSPCQRIARARLQANTNASTSLLVRGRLA